METINNNQMHEYTTEHIAFDNNTGSAYARYKHNPNMHTDLYIVYSYGEHFPMYVYDSGIEQWFGNETKYSPTTSKHQTLARPDSEDMTMLPTGEMLRLISRGGYREYCADRCGVLAFSMKPNRQ